MRISDKLTKKVLDLVETRNYQANHIAKSLKTGKTYTIGLIVADIANPFFAQIASEIEKEVIKNGYSVFFCSSYENKNNFNFQLENFKNRQVDGLILIPPMNSDKILTKLGSQNIPFVIMDRIIENLGANSITSTLFAILSKSFFKELLEMFLDITNQILKSSKNEI